MAAGDCPLVIFEDDDILVVNKPAGMNAHAPDVYAGEGLFEWLRDREPRWAGLAVVQRLDKDTSGVMVFAKTARAARLLAAQFEARTVRKTYVLLTKGSVPAQEVTAQSTLVRRGVSRPAVTRFCPQPAGQSAGALGLPDAGAPTAPPTRVVLAHPLTGRTHQIRAQAAELGFPVLGDPLYGGGTAAAAGRLYLHSLELTLHRPVDDGETTFRAPPDFGADPRPALRHALLDREETDAYRVMHGAADGSPGWFVDRFGDYLLSHAERPPEGERLESLIRLAAGLGARGVYHRETRREARGSSPAALTPSLVSGEAAPAEFPVRENGLRLLISFAEGYSVGLFLDQRDNRRRLLQDHVGAGFPAFPHGAAGAEVLNAFAYTCGFSVAAAVAGARVTSLDLSKKYLEWGRRNFAANGIDPAQHDFIYGDVFDWAGRLVRKGRVYDVVLVDPPTFSTSKQRGVFRAEKDYGKLVGALLPLLKPGGVLFASTNAVRLAPAAFLAMLEEAIAAAGRRVTARRYAPQPPDFPITREEPAHLKTVWLKVE
jgi:23S rRNA (cytosine1962-C5)-methyltransferase